MLALFSKSVQVNADVIVIHEPQLSLTTVKDCCKWMLLNRRGKTHVGNIYQSQNALKTLNGQ